MQKQKLLGLLGVSGALLLFGGLVAKSLSVDNQQHQQYRTLMAQQLDKDATVNQSVLKARYALLNLLRSPRPIYGRAARATRGSQASSWVYWQSNKALLSQLNKNNQVFTQKGRIS